jgi:hypothetical protein
MQTLEVKVAGLFTRIHAVSKSNGTFKQLLLQECTGLRESKIPFVIRASEFNAISEPEVAQRSTVFTVSCAAKDVVKIQNHLHIYTRSRKDIRSVSFPCTNGWDSRTAPKPKFYG